MELYPGNKRYLTLDYHLKQTFNSKVCKVPINAGFTCPNIDGTRGSGGCTYCSSAGSGEFAGRVSDTIEEQFKSVATVLHKKWPIAKYIAYFQAHTNTYAPLDDLKQAYEKALTIPHVVGLSIATRADSLPDGVLDYLEELNNRTYLIVELGLQTVHDETANHINRCHSYEEFLEGFWALHRRGIRVCVHVINGLPGEDKTMMLETIKTLSTLPIHSIKIHLLHLLKGTAMAEEYENKPFHLLTLPEYIDIVCDQIELLPPDVVIQRLTGDGAKDDLIGPLWSKNKLAVRNGIDKELKRRHSFQGIYYEKL